MSVKRNVTVPRGPLLVLVSEPSMWGVSNTGRGRRIGRVSEPLAAPWGPLGGWADGGRMTTAHHISTRQVVLAAIASLALMLVASPAFLASDIAALEGGARAPWRAVPADAPLSIDRATRARKALRRPTHARTWKMSYTAHNGALRDAVVVLPDWYGPHRHPPLPMVISPHGRGLNGASNARLWGDLPALGSFVLVSPDGEGRRRHDTSWGWRGQIDDLARMPK